MHCCVAVQAACRKQQNTATLNGRKRWGEGGGLFCSLELHYLSTMSVKSFVDDCSSVVNTLDCLEPKMIFVSLLIGVALSKKHNANCRLL